MGRAARRRNRHLEADAARAHPDRLRAGTVDDLRRPLQDVEHGLDVDRGLFDLAIDHAHKVQRLIKLDHHGVDHDEIADGVAAVLDAVGAQHHRRRKPDREHRGLAGIEHGERRVRPHARGLVALHRTVVTLRLALLGGEILHRFVVEQRVDGLGVGVVVAVVHPAPDRECAIRSRCR